MGRSRTGGDRVQAALRVQEAVQLRIGGATVREIGRSLGISFQQAAKIIAKALDETRARTAPEVERLREIEARRMDALIMAGWPKRADPKVGRVIIGASERRARLLGLDAPLRLEDATPKDLPPDEYLSNLTLDELRDYQRLLNKVRTPPPTLDAEVTEVPPDDEPLPGDDDEPPPNAPQAIA